MNLLVFLTAGVSFSQWRRIGILERELALYRALARRGHRIGFISYGGREDRAEIRALRHEFRVGHNALGLSHAAYARFLPLLHARLLRWADVVKANQTNGAEVALRAARWHHRPLVARSGFHWSEFMAARQPFHPHELDYARRVEHELAQGARLWITTTPGIADSLAAAHPGLRDRLRQVPNFVDTALFQPLPREPEVDVLWVGRLENQKRPQLLVDTLRLLPGVTSAWIGQGSLADSIHASAADLNPAPAFLGAVPHPELPAHFNRARLYVMCSHREGHPKTLLEAMACGAAIVAVDAPGIREVLAPDRLGLLCPPEPAALAAAIRGLLDDPDRRAALGRAAREHALREYSLDRVAAREEAVLQEALSPP
jgi:glycosyltransferase involved in cell wall biosynthesis